MRSSYGVASKARNRASVLRSGRCSPINRSSKWNCVMVSPRFQPGACKGVQHTGIRQPWWPCEMTHRSRKCDGDSAGWRRIVCERPASRLADVAPVRGAPLAITTEDDTMTFHRIARLAAVALSLACSRRLGPGHSRPTLAQQADPLDRALHARRHHRQRHAHGDAEGAGADRLADRGGEQARRELASSAPTWSRSRRPTATPS